jgi:hypothetical protein
MKTCVLPMTPEEKVTEFWIGWWDIRSPEETEISKVLHQELVDNTFSTLKI